MSYRSAAIGAAICASALSVSAPASAALVVNPNGSITASGTAGGTAMLNFNGFADGSTIPGLTGALQLTFAGFSGNSALFNFVLTNTSSSPITGSRLTIFGFNVDPDITGATVTPPTSDFTEVVRGGSAGSLGVIEVCFGGANCNGGGPGGPTLGQSASGTISLNFASPVTSVTLDNFYLRYQSINAPSLNIQGGSARGRVTPPVPEPGTWAMMLLGFGAVGFAMRRGRNVRAQLKGGLPQLA
mgnify:CR=1 FL=1